MNEYNALYWHGKINNEWEAKPDKEGFIVIIVNYGDCYNTCFSLHIHDNNFDEVIKEIETGSDGMTVKVVAWMHVPPYENFI